MTKVIEPADIYKCLDLEDLPGEIWKDVNGYEGLYQISNLGRAKTLKGFSGIDIRILKPQKVKAGYLYIKLLRNSSRKNQFLHRLVSSHFIHNPENKPQVNHKNGIKTDNRVENLEWATSSENLKHAHRTGLKKAVFGEKCGTSTMTNEFVVAIAIRIRNGDSITDLANEFSLNRANLYCLKCGKTWSQLTGFNKRIRKSK